MAKDDWLAAAQSNTEQLGNSVKDLERQLDRRDYREFWSCVKSVSQLFKELKPTVREERESLWQRFGELCARAKQDQGRERDQRQNVSRQKRQLVLSKIDEAYHQAHGAKSGQDLRVADDLLQQALGWMKDGFSGFGIGT
jgi:ABC-type transporter Mla subunit MlaD